MPDINVRRADSVAVHLQAGRRLIQERRPLPESHRDPSGRFVSEVRHHFKRLNPHLKPIARILIGTSEIAGPQSDRCRAPGEPGAGCRVDRPLYSLSLLAGLRTFLRCERFGRHSSSPLLPDPLCSLHSPRCAMRNCSAKFVSKILARAHVACYARVVADFGGRHVSASTVRTGAARSWTRWSPATFAFQSMLAAPHHDTTTSNLRDAVATRFGIGSQRCLQRLRYHPFNHRRLRRQDSSIPPVFEIPLRSPRSSTKEI
jgi:hypothetical protein